MIDKEFNTHSDLTTFINSNTNPPTGKYFVKTDETRNNNPAEYYLNAGKVLRPVTSGVSIGNIDLF